MGVRPECQAQPGDEDLRYLPHVLVLAGALHLVEHLVVYELEPGHWVFRELPARSRGPAKVAE